MENLYSNNNQEKKIDVIEIISVFWAEKKFIIAVTSIVTLLMIGATFFMTPTFLSTATILPDMNQSKLGPLADLASLAGVNIGGEVIMVKLYPDIMQSEAVLKPVIEKKYNSKFYDRPVDLYEYFEIEEESPLKNYEYAIERLRKSIKIELSAKTGLISYSIETKDAQVSADILNSLTESLNNFLLSKKTSNAGDQRKWIETRLNEVKKDMELAENNLKDFREKNRKIGDSPQLMLEQERLLREVQIQNSIFLTLKQQYELARIEEIKSVPIVNVMDEARPAARKNNPKRRLMTTVAFLIGFLGSCTFVFIKNYYSEEVNNFLKIFKKSDKAK